MAHNLRSRTCLGESAVVRPPCSYALPRRKSSAMPPNCSPDWLDMGFMRQIGLAKRRMAPAADGEEKITLLGQITRMETARKDLQAQIYGNTVG